MSKKVLFVDDEEDCRKVIGSWIESWGYEVITAPGGNEAIDVLKTEKVGAVVIDYLMPDIDGISLLRKIRAMDKEIPAIMFTAHPDEEPMEDADKLNISAFIPKISPHTDTTVSLRTALDLVFKEKSP